MANYETNEAFHRRFKEKFAEHYNIEPLKFEEGDAKNSTQPAVKKSPFSVQNFLWLGAAISVFHFSDFLNVVLYDMRIRSAWFWVGIVSESVYVSIGLFLILWLTFVKKISSDEWETRYPAAVPVATASLVIGLICLCVGLWPAWGFLTPAILMTLVMGIVVVVAMLG